jgi:hypothetical protein
MIAKWIGEGLLVLVALPILFFQSLEGIEAFLQMLAELSEWRKFLK